MTESIVFNEEAVTICYCREAFKTPMFVRAQAHVHLSDLRQALGLPNTAKEGSA